MASRFVTVKTFAFVTPAEVAKSALEQAGIPCFLADANLVAMDWFMGNAIGWIKLQVAQEDVERALAAIDSLEKSKLGAVPFDNDDGFQCLHCGHQDIDGVEVCSECGWTFQEA